MPGDPSGERDRHRREYRVQQKIGNRDRKNDEIRQTFREAFHVVTRLFFSPLSVTVLAFHFLLENTRRREVQFPVAKIPVPARNDS